MSQIVETNANLLLDFAHPDKIILHMTNMTVKIQTGGLIITLDLLLQTVITMKTILVFLELVPNQLLLIGLLHIVIFVR